MIIMSLKVRQLVIIGCLITSVVSAETRRRSRIDSPIQIPADAPFEDNLATASDVSEAIEELPPLSVVKEQKKEEVAKEKDNSGESLSDECEATNISFELVTG